MEIKKLFSKIKQRLISQDNSQIIDGQLVGKDMNYILATNCIRTRKGAIRRWFRISGFGEDAEGEYIIVTKERDYKYKINKEDFCKYIEDGEVVQLPQNQNHLDTDDSLKIPIKIETNGYKTSLVFLNGDETVIEDTTECSTAIGQS